MAKKAETIVLQKAVPVVPSKERVSITPLAIDYPHEYLNDMARKINQVIDHLNEN